MPTSSSIIIPVLLSFLKIKKTRTEIMNKHSITHASSLVSQSGEIDDEQDNGNNVRVLLLLLCV